MPSLAPELARRTNARDRVLAALLAAGSAGCTNVELNGICFRYGARILELRREWVIDKVFADGGVYRYILRGRREPVQADLWGAA